MTIGTWFARFWQDDQVAALLILIAVDFVLGVLAAFKIGNFRLSYVSDFLRNDVLFKVIPYFIVYGAMIVTDGKDVILGVIDFGDIAGATFATLLAALAASILGSLNTLKEAPAVKQSLKAAVVAPENAAPPKD